MAQQEPAHATGAWERRALAAALVEDHGVDVAWVGDGVAADGVHWECRACAAREAREARELEGGRGSIPGGRFTYCSLRGLIRHLQLQHDVWVY